MLLAGNVRFFLPKRKRASELLGKHKPQLGGKRPIIHPVNLFMYSRIFGDGTISVERSLSKAGDKIVLKAKIDMRLGIAACSVSESNCNGGKCTAIKVIAEN